MSRASTRGSGQQPADVSAELARIERLMHQTPEATADRICAEIARILQVQHTEVALLRAEKDVLKFLFPAELRSAGSIPMSSSAVAARTAVTKTSVLSNTFIKVKHVSLFETVRLAPSETDRQEPAPIQKLMSVPVHGVDGKILGVIQISRKGFDQSAVGPDFAMEDLRLLESIAVLVGKMELMSGPAVVSAR